MAPVRLAVIGLGDWGERHVSALGAIEDVKLEAVCDVNAKRAAEVASRYGVKHVYTNFDKLLESETLDAVDVVTPEKQHRDIVVEAAKRGLHVFVEKPIAASLADADAMIDAAEKKHISLLVGHVLRWDARYAMVKERISSGSVGKIAAISARRTCSRLGAARYLPYITPIMQTAVHDIDLILWFTGSYVVECFSRPARALEYENPDTTLSILSLANGTEVSLLNSFSLPEKIPFWSGARMEIYGSKMFVVVDATEQLLFLCDEVGWSNPDTTLAPILGGSIAGSLKDELSYFVRCVSKGEKPGVILPSEARNALEVAISCEKSLASGEPVRLNSSKR